MMDDEDAMRYPPIPYAINRGKNLNENVNSHPYDDDGDNEDADESDDINSEEQGIENNDDEDDDDDDDDADDDDDDADGEKGVQRISINDYEENSDEHNSNGDLQKHPKKRNLRALLSSYEFAPRVPPPSSIPKRSSSGRNPLKDWTEMETFILLNAWGERFVKQGTKSLRSEEWQEVAEKVSNDSKTERTDSQCRNRLDTLKKKYKKEKTKSIDSEWVYFKKMDSLLSSVQEKPGLSCGVDSGEFVFMNPKVYLNRSNGLDEMMDSPGDSESAEGEEDNYNDTPPKRKKNEGETSLKLIADSIHKFSEVYEKIESGKREQMVELERLRMDLCKDLELQKRMILEKAQAEIVKIRQGGEEENGTG